MAKSMEEVLSTMTPAQRVERGVMKARVRYAMDVACTDLTNLQNELLAESRAIGQFTEKGGKLWEAYRDLQGVIQILDKIEKDFR